MTDQSFVSPDSNAWLKIDVLPGVELLLLAQPVPDGSIHKARLAAGTVIPVHTHPADEYVLVLSGTIETGCDSYAAKGPCGRKSSLFSAGRCGAVWTMCAPKDSRGNQPLTSQKRFWQGAGRRRDRAAVSIYRDCRSRHRGYPSLHASPVRSGTNGGAWEAHR